MGRGTIPRWGTDEFFVARWDMFRELGDGVMFFLCAALGTLFGAMLWSSHISHGPEEHNAWLVQGAIGGAIIGGAAWLWYKYNFLRPPNNRRKSN
jgi:hypothetical protein